MLNFNDWLIEEEFKLWEEVYTKESILDILKGAYGTGKGLLRAGHGFMTVGDEALAKMVGDGTKGRMTQGWKDLGGGLKDVFIGGSPKPKHEPIVKTIEKPAQPVAAKNPEPIVRKNEKQPTIQTTTQDSTKETWEDLAKQYNAATSEKERRALQIRLAQTDPVKYQQALERAYKLKLRRHAMRSGQRVTT